jgi:hypothetical protein
VAAGALIDNEADANEGRIIGRWFAKEKRADPRGRAADDVWLTGHDLATAAPGFTSVVVPAPAPFPPEVDPALYPRPFWPDSQDPLNPNNFPEVEPGVEGGE